MLRTCQDILPFGAIFLAFLPVCSIVSLVLRCWVGVLHSYSPFSVSTVLTISSVPNSVILNLRLLPKIKAKFNDIHEGRCGNERLRRGNFFQQSCPPFHTFLSKFSSFWVAVSSSVWEFWKSRRVPFDYDRGGSRIFFRRGCTRLLLYFKTNKSHSFSFLQNTSCIRKPQVTWRGGGAHPLHPPPRSAPVWGSCGLVLLIQQYKNSYPVPNGMKSSNVHLIVKKIMARAGDFQRKGLRHSFN